jgi:hypothetical protein
MFGNRKRKSQEEDESLVPHGLIWHATEEPTPDEVAKSEEALGYTVNYAQEIERARRAQSTGPTEQRPNVASPADPIKSEAIPWWRVEHPEPPVERPVSKLAPMPLSAYVPTPIEPAAELTRPSRIQPMQIRPMPVQPVQVNRVAVPRAAVQPIQAVPTETPEARPPQILQPSAPQVEGSLAKSVQAQASPISGRLLSRKSQSGWYPSPARSPTRFVWSSHNYNQPAKPRGSACFRSAAEFVSAECRLLDRWSFSKDWRARASIVKL